MRKKSIIFLAIFSLYPQLYSMALWRRNNPYYDPTTDKIRRRNPLKSAKIIQEKSLLSTENSTSLLDTIISTGESDFQARQRLQQTCKYMYLYFDTKNKDRLFYLVQIPHLRMSDDELKRALALGEWYGKSEITKAVFNKWDMPIGHQQTTMQTQLPFFQDLDYDMMTRGGNAKFQTCYNDLNHLRKLSYQSNHLAVSELLRALGSSLLVDDDKAIDYLSHKIKNDHNLKIENLIAHFSLHISLLKIAINADNEKSFIAFIKNNTFFNEQYQFLDNDENIPGTLLYDLSNSPYLSESKKKKYIMVFKRCGGINLKNPSPTETSVIEKTPINDQLNSCIIF